MMRIQELELHNFGRFRETRAEFQDGINLIYGENESGKSTLHTFIKGMFFGIERGRGRAAAHDVFHKYEPWENPGYYCGGMTFECGGRRFRLERSFDKYNRKAELFCLDDGEELSVEDGDLEMLLLGLDASGYENTVCIGQLSAETSEALADQLKNYATNYYESGDGEIDFAGAQNFLRGQRKELERQEKAALRERRERRAKAEQECEYVRRDIDKLEEELETVQDEIACLDETGKGQKEDGRRALGRRLHPAGLVGSIAAAVAAFFVIPKPWNSLVSIILALICGIYVWNRLKDGRRKTEPEPESLSEETITDKRASKEALLGELNHIRSERREKQIQYENLQEQLAEWTEFGDEDKAREKRRSALELAERRLGEISAKLRENLSRELNERASEILKEITGGRYSRLFVDENLHMSLLGGEHRADMEQVSQGTLEQVYFALRMAASSLIHEEEYPVILDDTFVFYDDERLRNTLRWLARQGRQVLIFTCQRREEQMLREMGVEYGVTVLSN